MFLAALLLPAQLPYEIAFCDVGFDQSGAEIVWQVDCPLQAPDAEGLVALADQAAGELSAFFNAENTPFERRFAFNFIDDAWVFGRQSAQSITPRYPPRSAGRYQVAVCFAAMTVEADGAVSQADVDCAVANRSGPVAERNARAFVEASETAVLQSRFWPSEEAETVYRCFNFELDLVAIPASIEDPRCNLYLPDEAAD